jgi:hypothetical protein
MTLLHKIDDDDDDDDDDDNWVFNAYVSHLNTGISDLERDKYGSTDDPTVKGIVVLSSLL